MFARRLALRPGRLPYKKYNLASSVVQRTQLFQTQRSSRSPISDDKPAYQYDPHKHQSARPLFIPGPRNTRHSGVILVILGTSGTIFYVSNIEEVPVTGRKRFNCFSQQSAEEQGEINNLKDMTLWFLYIVLIYLGFSFHDDKGLFHTSLHTDQRSIHYDPIERMRCEISRERSYARGCNYP